uniref:Uncharacterized protein n=1 Tax=Anguilla anguilla TaxID=7936 RepID=A0A0E9UYA6_ANGAN
MYKDYRTSDSLCLMNSLCFTGSTENTSIDHVYTWMSPRMHTHWGHFNENLDLLKG